MDSQSAGSQQACRVLRCIQDLWSLPTTSSKDSTSPSYPPISSIPRTSPERLAQASYNGRTYLYLAYGSNMSAETFLGVRGIRPLSKINVKAPAFDLTFDLPGIPYREPCFANVAPRKHFPSLPKPPQRPPHFPDPPKPPEQPPQFPDPPKPPERPPQFPDPPPTPLSASFSDSRTSSSNDDVAVEKALLFPALPPRAPTWSKGLIGVVYEVTHEDYATIIRTEGGGAGYLDVQTPVVALAEPISVPEKPPIPELPRFFFAHTLCLPRLPDDDDDDENGYENRNENDDDDNDKKKKKKKNWWLKFVTPVRRPEPDYAQPSARYLKLITDGAREHYLPDDYQAYLRRLQAYMLTRRRQAVGKWLFTLLWLPLVALVMALGRLLSDRDGNAPRWLAVVLCVLLNLMWMSYDAVFVKRFGDGERTMEDDEDGGDGDDDNAETVPTRNKGTFWQHMEDGTLNEKNRLLSDW